MNRSLLAKMFIFIMSGLLANVMAYAEDGSKMRDGKMVDPQLYMGPGPVVSISESYSSLPDQIKKFIPRHFNNALAKSVEKKTLENMYEIEMSNGYELKFSAEGNWRKVEAPKKKVISQELLRSLLPVNTFRYLVEKKAEKKVKEISFDPRKGYKIELKKHHFEEMYFNTAGNYLSAED